jgi:acyl-CoA synthetase (AMP-forming)/AMP-acid ligase II
MPKAIATTPSWYWPDRVPRVLGTPPYYIEELLVERWAHRQPAHPSLVSSDARTGAAELAESVRAVAAALTALTADTAPDRPVAVSAGPTAEGAVLVLGALASGRKVLLAAPGATIDGMDVSQASLGIGDPAGTAELSAAGLEALRLDALVARAPAAAGTPGGDVAEGSDGLAPSVRADGASGLGAPVACMVGRYGSVWHSHHSLLAGAVALGAFLGSGGDTAWLSTYSPCTWEGLCGLTVALLAGSTMVLAEPRDAAVEAAAAEHPAWLLSSLADGVATWGGGKRSRRAGGEGVRAALLMVDGPFDPDERRAVAPAAGGTALTMFGMAETGVVLASHPSWYLEESVGIPVPNMHVVAADPDTGQPISSMWELVDHAMVTAWSPSLAVAGEAAGDGQGPDGTDGHIGGQTASGFASRFVGRRFVTGVLAASDPNGMLYLVDE